MRDTSTSRESTQFVLRGTLIGTTTLAVLLLIQEFISATNTIGIGVWVLAIGVLHLLGAWLSLQKGLLTLTNWMIISTYMVGAGAVLLIWGLESPVGIAILCIAVTLPSVLVGTKLLLPTIFTAAVILFLVQMLHANEIVPISVYPFLANPTLLNLLVYVTILSMLGLILWLPGRQREKNLQRALAAEATLRTQKEALRAELAQESAKLRQSQLKQVRELHNFATLGQITAATLHDLSTLVSILNFDIDDLRSENKKSKAVKNAQSTIDSINKMVHDARNQLDSYESNEPFNAVAAANQCLKDVRGKFKQKNVKLTKLPIKGAPSFITSGSSFALMQIMTILLNNAADACKGMPGAEVKAKLTVTPKTLVITIEDNGPGIHTKVKNHLFDPKVSTKESGLGVGLYIAHHLAESIFKGELELVPSTVGAHFKITIPSKTVKS